MLTPACSAIAFVVVSSSSTRFKTRVRASSRTPTRARERAWRGCFLGALAAWSVTELPFETRVESVQEDGLQDSASSNVLRRNRVDRRGRHRWLGAWRCFAAGTDK